MNNLNNGLMFGMEGPNMEGTWYNPKTGDSFTVRNSFFQDNQYIVQTTDGRILDYNTLQSYIQSDRPIEMPAKMEDNLPAEVADLVDSNDFSYDILPEDLNMINGSKSLGNLSITNNTTQGDPIISIPYTQVDQNFAMIEKALAKKSMPDIQVSIDWKNFPQREMDMLIDIMDVNEDEIIDWYVRQIDINYLAECLKEVVKDHIHKQLSPEAITPKIDIPIVEVKEEKKKTRRTQKSKSKSEK